MPINYYEILELSSTSVNQESIQRKYQELKSFYQSEQFREASGFTDEELRALLETLDEAYTVLGNSTLKSLYDEKLQKKNPVAIIPDSVATHPTSTAETSNASRVAASPKPMKLQVHYQVDPAMEEWIKSCTQWTGEALKKVREYKGVDLTRLSEVTKINPFYLDAIERMEPEHLPAIVFVRGYLKQIVKALDLPEQEVLNSYLKLYQKACERTNKQIRKI